METKFKQVGQPAESSDGRAVVGHEPGRPDTCIAKHVGNLIYDEVWRQSISRVMAGLLTGPR